MKKSHIFLVICLLVSLMPSAQSAPKSIAPQPIDYSDVTGPQMLKIKIDTDELNLNKKSAVIRATLTVSDDLNSVSSPNIYFSRLDSLGKITKGKLFGSKNLVRISSNKTGGQVIEVFEMFSTFPKGLAKGNYQLLTGDFRDLVGNRRVDLALVNAQYDLLPVVSVN